MGEEKIVILDVPFFPNDEKGVQCMQVAMRMALNYFLKKDFSLQELDRLTGRKENYWTWTQQIVPVLYNLGLDVKYYSISPMEPYLSGAPYIRKTFPTAADNILKNTDMPVMLESVKNLLRYSLFEQKNMGLEEIETHLRLGHLVFVLIDYNVLNHILQPFQGHFVAIVGIDESTVYYHESGPKGATPNKAVPKSDFIAAMNAEGTDHDVVVVFGKRIP